MRVGAFEVVDDSSGMAGFTSALQDAATGSGGSSGERRAEVVQSSWSSAMMQLGNAMSFMAYTWILSKRLSCSFGPTIQIGQAYSITERM